MLLRRFRYVSDGKESHLTRSVRISQGSEPPPLPDLNVDRIQDVVSVFGLLVLPTKTTWIAANLLNCQSQKKCTRIRSAYAVVIASTLSGSIRIPNTRTAEKTAVKTKISPSLISRCSTKNSITIGTTGNTLEMTVIMPFAIHCRDESANEYT